MKKISLTSVLCSALLLGIVSAGFAMTQDQTPGTDVGQTASQTDATTNELVEAAQARLVQGAIDALSQSNAALEALQKKDTVAALDDLADAIGKLELVSSVDPEMNLVPIDVHQRLYDLYANAAIVDDVRERAIKYLRDGNVPEARLLLSNLASELVIETTSIPLGLYPDALKEMVPLITDHKIDEAITALKATLDTLVVTRVAVPLPVLRAVAAIENARKIADKEETLSNEQVSEINGMLDEARSQLRLSVALGYSKRGALKELHKEIEQVRTQVTSGKLGKHPFANIIKNLKTKSTENKENVNTIPE